MTVNRVIPILCQVWRGRARHLYLYSLVGVIVFWGASGCGHTPQPLAPQRYVRVDSLLGLHPSWAQVQSMDREIARLKLAPEQSGVLTYAPFPSLTPFTPQEISPTNMAAARSDQIENDARRYVNSLQRSIEEANQAILSLERRREQKRVQSEVVARLAKVENALRDVNEVKVFANTQRIRTLTFRDLVVQSRVQDLAQAVTRDRRSLRDAQAEHASILAEIDRLKVENRSLTSQDVAREAARQRDAITREEEAKSLERVRKREDELKADEQDKLQAARSLQRDTKIPPPAQQELPPPERGSTPLPLPEDTNAPAGHVVATATTAAALDRQASVWRAQRSSLVAAIRADTEKAVQQVAQKRGWRLVPVGRLGALDATDEAADDIRSQWQIGKEK